MLCELTIENVAVISKATITFGDGLNVLTGETGAGKSILIDSINAILGNRTSRDIVRAGTQKSSIWASFSDINEVTKLALDMFGYDSSDDLLLYREISVDGKSVCRINGKPCNVTILKEVCNSLINIHGQHDNQSLLNPQKHIEVLDTFAQNSKEKSDYFKSYHELYEIDKEISELSIDETEKERLLDTLRYQVDEIMAADLVDGEEEELAERRNKIQFGQKIADSLNTAYLALSGQEEMGAVDALRAAEGSIEDIADISTEYSDLSERISELFYSVQDMAIEVKNLLDDADVDMGMLEEIEERLDLIYKLKRKYGNSVQEIIEFGEKASEDLENIEFSDEKIEKLQSKRDEIFNITCDKADILTKTRKEAFERMALQISQSLEFLNMPGIKFSLSYKEIDFTSKGQDDIEFFISTNRGEEPKPLAKIASGGELSRIMLAIKSALADRDDISTLIYDEIDTGVSGLAAGRIGEKLKQTSVGRQIICVTHTAQIAAFADTHLLIHKDIDEDRTYTKVDVLDENSRVRELARIISGDKVTDLSLASAKELLQLSNNIH